jgi:hypothetical protein
MSLRNWPRNMQASMRPETLFSCSQETQVGYIKSWINSAHILTIFLNNNFNIILEYTRLSIKLSLLFKVSD